MNREWLAPSSLASAKQSQKEMAEKVVLQDQFQNPPALIGGVDVSYTRFDPTQTIFAAAVTLSYPDLNIVEREGSKEKQTFPYISGFLGFREAPSIIHALLKLPKKPDLLFVDGQGVAHPRSLGIASHLGVLLDIPTIGVAKSILIGTPAKALGEEGGSQVPLIEKGEIIGIVLRSKKGCLPLIISAGHRITLFTAVAFVQNCLKGYRLPEPTRQAHLAAGEFRERL